MFSRMYTKLMNVYSWIESADVLHAHYQDTGFFGIYATCQPGKLHSLLEVVCRQLNELARDPFRYRESYSEELSRAKNQLKTNIFLALEQRNHLVDDIGRQILIYDRHKSLQEIFDKIDKVTVEDCGRVTKELISRRLTVVALGLKKKFIKIRDL